MREEGVRGVARAASLRTHMSQGYGSRAATIRKALSVIAKKAQTLELRGEHLKRTFGTGTERR